MIMKNSGPENEKRIEKRIRFLWPIWFGYESRPNEEFHRGQVVDLSSKGVGFIVDEHCCPNVGEHVLTRFSYPTSENGSFAMDDYLHWSEVIRVEPMPYGKKRVAFRLHQQLEHDFDKITDSAPGL